MSSTTLPLDAKVGGSDKKRARKTVRDKRAGALLARMRVDRGLSREALPHAMLDAGIDRKFIPSTSTIYNVEVRGMVPRVRLQFGLATFYERKVSQIWDGDHATAGGTR